MAREINFDKICKVEGHASLDLKVRKNRVEKCHLETKEGARFFEGLVLGKKVKDVQEIVSRICGICSSAHSVCSIQALEKALRIRPTKQQKILRELLMIGERIRSHITHLYFLALPDYYGFSSALSMNKKHREKVKDATTLIRTGNRIVRELGGRDMHPLLGIKKGVPKKDFSGLREKLIEAKPLIRKTIDLFLSLNYPKMERNADQLCLRNKNYATLSGKIVSRSGLIEVEDYKKHLKENIKEYATSKFVLKDGWPFQTGAMARINNNKDRLDKETKNYLKKVSLPLKNPYHNNIAQALELLHLTNRAIELIGKISGRKESKEIKIKKGHAVAAVEAPRGTLFHEYKIDKEGKINYCNIIPPTTQNLNLMEKDIKKVVEHLMERNAKRKEIVRRVEELIRAYDPCFSCSSHFLKVKWL